LQQIEQTEAPQSEHSATTALPQLLSSTAEPYSMVQNNVIPDLDSGLRNAGCHGLAVEQDKDQNTAFVVPASLMELEGGLQFRQHFHRCGEQLLTRR
jgi:hypothetical protein